MPVYNPTGAVRRDEILTNISVGYPQEGLVGNVLFPPIRVNKQSARYNVFGRESWQPEDDVRAPGTVANEIPGLRVSEDTYFCDEHALQIAVTDEERENNTSPIEPFRDGTEMVTGKMLLGRELDQYDLASNPANYAAGMSTTLVGGAQWNTANYATSNPIADFKTGKRAVHAQIYLEPNVAIIPYEAMGALEDHPDFIERIKYSERAVLTEEIISSLLGIGRVVIPGVYRNTANPGQAASLGYVWGNDVIIAYVPQRAGTRVPAFGYEFVWAYGGKEQAVDRWREDQRKSDLVRVQRRYDHKLVAKDVNGKAIAGYLLQNVIP